jgi:hypothetical protein
LERLHEREQEKTEDGDVDKMTYTGLGVTQALNRRLGPVV